LIKSAVLSLQAVSMPPPFWPQGRCSARWYCLATPNQSRRANATLHVCCCNSRAVPTITMSHVWSPPVGHPESAAVRRRLGALNLPWNFDSPDLTTIMHLEIAHSHEIFMRLGRGKGRFIITQYSIPVFGSLCILTSFCQRGLRIGA
jgi:hypothetical protein